MISANGRYWGIFRLEQHGEIARGKQGSETWNGTDTVRRHDQSWNLQEDLEVLLHPETQANPKEPRQNLEAKTSQLISKQISSSRRAGQVNENWGLEEQTL